MMCHLSSGSNPANYIRTDLDIGRAKSRPCQANILGVVLILGVSDSARAL